MLAPPNRTSLTELEQLLNGGKYNKDLVLSDPVLGRIHQIMEARRQGADTGIADLAALIRHSLLSNSEKAQRATVSIRSFSSVADWEKFGLRETNLGRGVILEAILFDTQWLPTLESGHDAFVDVFEGRPIRQPSLVRIDPCVREVSGYESYTSPGQREAVRSVLHMPAGSTLVVNLPTGSGKTLVGQVPPLLDDGNGLTLFIVPTTALALDQARRMEEKLARVRDQTAPRPLAWFSELPQVAKDTIRQRIRSGTQGILFASPEAVRGPLLPSLYDAASRGLVRYLIVDEAHIVCEWGDGFRPDFQSLAGIRRGLMRHGRGEPLRTILMSATLTAETLGVLESLYGEPGPFQMVAAVHLRPEPRYMSVLASCYVQKVERVRTTVRHLPRPFLLYVTEPREAEEWLRLLRADGLRRVDAFHGDTPYTKRHAIITAWSENRLDGIVATSAFGVGMDKSDIRAVVHATVPETLDRYYQEVGRSGRDGRASVSVVVYEPADVPKARELGRPRFIGDDNAFVRWQTMFSRSRPIDGDTDLYEIDLTCVPPTLHQESDYNRGWNVRTLILMARSGLIQLDSSPHQVPDQLLGESESAYSVRIEETWQGYFNKILVRILDDAHQVEDHFVRRTAVDRDRATKASERSFDGLLSALDGGVEMGDVLSDLYTVREPGRAVIVSRCCRGCRAVPEDVHVHYTVPSSYAISQVTPVDLSDWRTRFPHLRSRSFVFYGRDTVGNGALLERALSALVGNFGIAEVAAPESAWSSPWLRNLHRRARIRGLITKTIEEPLGYSGSLPVPRATLLWPWDDQRVPDGILLMNRPLHVILAPDDIPSDHPLRSFAEMADSRISLDNFLREATR